MAPMKTNTLRVRRAERRVTQITLARQAGISENRYWRLENSYVKPTESEVRALATALGVDPSVIFPESSDAELTASA